MSLGRGDSLRVAIVCNSHVFGGGERYVATLAADLAARGDSVYLVAPEEAPVRSDPLLLGSAVRHVTLNLGPKLSRKTQGEFLTRWVAHRRAAANLVMGLLEAGVGVLHLQYKKEQLLLSRLARQRGLHVVWTEHGPLPSAFAKNPAARWWYRRSSRAVCAVIAVAEHVAQSIGGQVHPGVRVVAVPNGVRAPFEPGDAEHRRRRTEVRQRLGISGNTPIVLYQSRLDTRKLPDLVPEIAAAWRAGAACPVFVVAGTGEREMALRARAARGNGAVRVLGFQSDPWGLLAAADVFLSLTEEATEGLPYRCLEALAAGVPVVASDVPAHREAVRDGETGLVVPSRDPEILAAAVQRALETPFRRRAARAARDDARHRFDRRSWIEATRAVYEPCVEGECGWFGTTAVRGEGAGS